MKCLHCGYIVPDDSEFCPYCGSRVEAETTAQVNAPIAASAPAQAASTQSERDRITQSQRYFDPDYGYSPENPIVTSSVPMIGYYLASLRTSDGRSFTWERMARQDDSSIDAYCLYLDGKPYKGLYFTATGNDSEYVPAGLVKDADAFEAAKQGISLNQLIANREAEQKKAEQGKARRKRVLKVAALVCLLIVLAVGGYYGYIYGVPYLRYQIAISSIEKAPDKAIEIFTDLGNYKDSEALRQWGEYYRLKQMFEHGEYEAILDEYSNSFHLDDQTDNDGAVIRDSKRALSDIEKMLNESRISLAKAAIADGKYEDAISVLSGTKNVQVGDIYAECYYNLYMQGYEKKDWAQAYYYYSKLAILRNLSAEYDINTHLQEILEQYAQLNLDKGTEHGINVAAGAIKQLEKRFGQTEKLAELKKQYQDAYIENEYQNALKEITTGYYGRAIRFLKELGDYKDSHELLLEAMYQYVHTEKAPSRNSGVVSIALDPYFEYAKTLSDENYKDSKQFYTDLTAWHVYTIMNNDPKDNTTQLYSISKYDNCCVHIVVVGGALGETVRLKYVFTMSNGSTTSGKWDWDMRDGSTADSWCYYNQPQYAPTGTCRVRIYNADTGKLMAEDSIRIVG